MSVSRVRENLTHGLTGGGWKRSVDHGHRDGTTRGETTGTEGLWAYRGTTPPRQPPTLLRTGNSAKKFNQLDSYVWRRLVCLLVKQRGRNLRAGQVQQWTADWFRDQGLYRLRGTVRYPKAA